MPLKVQMQSAQNGVPRYVLSGHLDETVQMQKLVGELPQQAVLNLSQVERYNSTGLMHWVKWIRDATRDRDVTIEAISYILVIQANHLLDLFGRADVVSCVAPYFCARCNVNRQVLVAREEIGERSPVKQCEQCGTEMDFDDLDEYFAFFRRPA